MRADVSSLKIENELDSSDKLISTNELSSSVLEHNSTMHA